MSLGFRVRALCVAAVLVSSAFAAFASDPWDAPAFASDPKELVAAAEKVSTGDASFVVLLDEARYTFDAAGRSHVQWRHMYRIAEESSIEALGTLEVPWAPWYDERPAVTARVVAKDGTVHMLDAKAITEAPARESLDIFSDNRLLRAPLPGVAVGSIIEYTVDLTGKDPIGDGGTADIFTFGGYAPTERARLVIDGPATLEPRIVNKSSIQAKTEEQNGRRVTTFESGRIAGRKDFEAFVPFDTLSLPYVAFSTGSSWQNLAKRYSEIVDKQLAGADLKKFTHDAIGDARTRGEIIARSLATIEKNVRYAGVEVGESSIIPRAPRIVLGNKYGDCKDKATLLVAMLREAGIAAHVVLLRAGSDFDVQPELPGLGRFNHAIVRVDATASAPETWVDPTDDFAHAGELPAPDQGRMVLVAAPDTTSLIKTPETAAAANRYTETRTYTLPEDGKARVVEVTETVSGSEDAMQRRFYAERDRTAYREQIEKYVKSYYVAKKLEKFEASDPHDLTKPFRVTIEASDAATGAVKNGDAAVALHPANLLSALPYPLHDFGDEHAEDARRKRAGDFLFPSPAVREWTYRVIPPAGYTPRTLPAAETKKLGTTTLTTEYVTEHDGSVTAHVRFDSGKRRITAAEFEETRAAVKKVFDEKPTIIGFDLTGAAKLNAGDVAGALAEFRKLAALHPKEAQHHIEIARALLIGGLGSAARDEARRAVALEPANALAHSALGGILQYDLLGRLLRNGCDRDGALTELRKAKELDPKNADYRGVLAKLLSYGADGVEYGRGAKLDESIAEFRAVATDVGEKEAKAFDGDLMGVLVHAGRFAEMKELAKATDDVQLRDAGRITAIAATEGAAAAIHELGAFDVATRRSYAQTIAQTLLSIRLYPQATEIFDFATNGLPNASSARPFIEALRKTKRIEDITIDDKEPRSVIARTIIAITRDDREALKKLAPFGAAPARDVEDGEEDADPLAAMRSLTRDANVSAAVAADLSFATLRVQTDGDDKTGYRLRIRNDSGATLPTMYVVEQNGAFVVRATTAAAQSIGEAALAFADAGDLDSARTWLNWVRDEVKGRSADDPLDVMPFASLWPKDNTTSKADDIRAAAASLMLQKKEPRGVATLLALRDKATDERKIAIDRALVTAYNEAEQWKEAIPFAEHLVAAYPDSEVAFKSLVYSLSLAGRTADAAELAKKRLAKKPHDEEALRALSSNAARMTDYAAAAKYAEQVVDELQPNQNDYNNAAWFELFVGKLDHAVDNARHATAEESQTSAAALHTLATLYAETGKNIEARDALLRTLDKSQRELPDSSDWYVLGRMAENYGVRDAALAAYKRVTKRPEGGASVWELAQRRLAAMK